MTRKASYSEKRSLIHSIDFKYMQDRGALL